MKLLLILESDDTSDLISLHLKPLGFEVLRYHQVLKAMDNVDEADPAAIIISANDFPRHWKTMTQFVRSERSKKDCPIILLHHGELPLEESNQAFHIGVSGIVDESLVPKEMERLQGILSRYVPTKEKRRSRRFFNIGERHFGFMMMNPKDQVIIPGKIKSISNTGLSFVPANSATTGNIEAGAILNECSLRAGSSILSPVCRLIRESPVLSLEFLSFPKDEYKILEEYLEALPLQELKDQRKKMRGPAS
ncbi:hypothetical protein FACS189476_02270 [Spirochaetia bacterium]|nr:hypothetical protein FACS189476_02270 [Spirochaetia bacterium]